jgi:dTDP-4-amino-4,6-dideoxygalactose transaminase
MTVLNDYVARHKKVHDLYKKLLKDVEGIKVHDNFDDLYDSNFWLTTITVDPEIRIKGQNTTASDGEPNPNVEALRVYMDAAGIEARPVWKPMHKQPVYKNCPAYVNGVSEAIFKVGMCLPAGPYVSDEDVRYIVEMIKRAVV